MNKTVNINLGGMFFHIDEDAYQKLTRYFDAIKRSLSKSSGQEEIIKDIEMRVSELLTEKQKNDKTVIALKEVDEVIAVMGQPEDYIIEEDNHSNSSNSYSNYTAPIGARKLYRDKENGMVGGVLAGLGHYFGIDKVWLRVFLLILVFAWGTGVLAYFILWVVMPEAITTSEKLEMTGEPVTISNIERKVREEFDNVSDKIKNADYDKFGNQVKTGAERLGSGLGDFITTLFKIFARVLGVILIMAGLSILVLLFVSVFTIGTSMSMNLPWRTFVEAGNFTDYPVWVFGLIMFLAVGIPLFFMTLLGFKLLSPTMKSVGNIVKYTLLAVWLIALSIAISIGIRQASAFAVNSRTVQKEKLQLNPADTLLIKFRHNNYFAKDVNDRNDFMITKDSLNNDIIYSNQVHIEIKKSDEKYGYIQIEKSAQGTSLTEAKKRSSAIRYNYKIVGNQLIFDNYLITDSKNKFRDQEIEITLFLPKGTLLKPDSSMAHYDETDSNFFLWHPSTTNELFRVEDNKIRCITCNGIETDNYDNNDDYDNDVENGDITINKNGITIQNNSDSASAVRTKKKFKELKINKDGIIIKTE